MSMHLFATPVECRQCGTQVTDPTLDKCPECGALLKERRTPGRLAGVEQRYGEVRFLVGTLRFLGVAFLLVGGLVLMFMLGETGPLNIFALVVGTIGLSVAMFVVASLFAIAVDIEENTRAMFRVQQQLMEGGARRKRPTPKRPPEPDPAPTPEED